MQKIINCETGEVIEREFSSEELAQKEFDKIDFLAKQAEAEVKAKAKAQLLARLGISEEEVKLLLS